MSNTDQELSLLKNKHLFVKVAYYLAGVQIHFDLLVTVGSLLLMGVSIGGVVYGLIMFIQRHGSEPLTTRHAMKLLIFWVILEFLLMPNIYLDFFYHHQWKIVTHNFPMSSCYDERPYKLDYPPLFAFLEYLESSLLAIFFPEDMKPTSLNRESDGFRVAMGMLNMLVNSSYWFALLKLFKTLEQSQKKVTVNAFVFCFMSSSLLFVDGARNQPNQFVLAFILLSFAYILE